MTTCYELDGTIVDAVKIDNRAYTYGDGFFTTVRVVDSRPQLWSYHLSRLMHSADALKISIDSSAIQLAVFTHADRIGQGVIKVHVSRPSDGIRGYAARASQSYTLISVMPDKPASSAHMLSLQPAKEAVVLSQRISLLPANLAGLKTVTRLENVLAANELLTVIQNQPKISQGIVCAVNETVIEGVSGNLFFRCDGMWMTPSLAHAGVAGTLRQAILDTVDIAVVDMPLSQLYDIEAAWLCNAVKGIQPLSSIYDVARRGYIVEQLDTQVVTQFHRALCDNSRFISRMCGS